MQNIEDMLALWRPATGDYRFTMPQLAGILGLPHRKTEDRRALRAECLALGVTYIGRARVYVRGVDIGKDNVYSTEDIEALWHGLTGRKASITAPKPAPRVKRNPDSMTERLRRVEAKLDALLRWAGISDSSL